jgi:HPt (histidine-containing phosphotransfer) domain-containing protein
MPETHPLPKAEPDAAVLDATALRRLRELDPDGRNQVIERVMRAFEGSLLRLLPQAADAHAEGDLVSVRHVVHTLKSSSASVGAIELSQRCAEIENRLRAGQMHSLGSLLGGLQAEGTSVLAAVRALRAS